MPWAATKDDKEQGSEAGDEKLDLKEGNDDVPDSARDSRKRSYPKGVHPLLAFLWTWRSKSCYSFTRAFWSGAGEAGGHPDDPMHVKAMPCCSVLLLLLLLLLSALCAEKIKETHCSHLHTNPLCLHGLVHLQFSHDSSSKHSGVQF